MDGQSMEENEVAWSHSRAEEALRDEEWRPRMVRCGGCGKAFDSDQSFQSHLDLEKDDFHYPSSLYSPMSTGAEPLADAKKGGWSSRIAALSPEELRRKIHGNKEQYETLP